MNKANIILYDGVCILCNKWVSYIIKNDKKKRFKFAPIQSKIAKNIICEIGGSSEIIDTIFLIKSDKFYTKFQASTYALYSVNKIFILLYALNLIFPKKFLDFFYDIVGSRRYQIFGMHDTCPLPDAETKDRFIND